MSTKMLHVEAESVAYNCDWTMCCRPDCVCCYPPKEKEVPVENLVSALVLIRRMEVLSPGQWNQVQKVLDG